MRAVNLGEPELVKALLDHGADINRNDVLGNTAVILAYEKDQTVIQELLKRKAKQATATTGSKRVSARCGGQEGPGEG